MTQSTYQPYTGRRNSKSPMCPSERCLQPFLLLPFQSAVCTDCLGNSYHNRARTNPCKRDPVRVLVRDPPPPLNISEGSNCRDPCLETPSCHPRPICSKASTLLLQQTAPTSSAPSDLQGRSEKQRRKAAFLNRGNFKTCAVRLPEFPTPPI